jgi:hypothetical protein
LRHPASLLAARHPRIASSFRRGTSRATSQRLRSGSAAVRAFAIRNFGVFAPTAYHSDLTPAR